MATTSARELSALLNTTLKQPGLSSMADDEVYKSGFWPTGQLPFDVVLGGGWAKGRHGLIYGESATLKSYVVLHTIAQVQKAGGTAVLVNTEKALSQEWAKDIGIDTSNLVVINPETGEQAIDAMEVLLRDGGVDFIGVDSIAALLPKADREIMLSGKDNAQPARIAALMSIGLRKLNEANKKSCVLWVTQMRANIGGMAFSPKTQKTGGKAIDFYISQSINIKKTGKEFKDVSYFNGEKDVTDKQIIGQNFRAELDKSRFGQPFKLSFFNFDLEHGRIDLPAYLIAQGLEEGYITKKGKWWYMTIANSNGEVLIEDKADGKDKFKTLVKEREDIQKALADIVCAKHGLENIYV